MKPPKFITIAWLAAHGDGGTDQERAASLLRSLHSDPDPEMLNAMARRLVERLADGAVPLTLLEDPVALLRRQRSERRPRRPGIEPRRPDLAPFDAPSAPLSPDDEQADTDERSVQDGEPAAFTPPNDPAAEVAAESAGNTPAEGV